MRRTTRPSARAHRRAAPSEAPPGRRRADYADRFEIALDRDDARTAEQWARAALERAHPVMRTLVWVAHTRVLRFRLAAAGTAGHVFGWRIEHVEPDVLVLAASGPLASAVLIGRRSEGTAMCLTTLVWFERALGRYVWWAVGPVHRRVAPYLLERTATTFVASATATERPASATGAHIA